MNLNKFKKIHLIGIGGIGMSAVARILIELGKDVSGSELVKSKITEDLQNLGVTIIIGNQKAVNIDDQVELVIYTNAVKTSNLEYKKAKQNKIKMYSYPEFLSEMMKTHISLVVSGTHGKSTTTAMLAKIFIEADLDPTVVIGTNTEFLKGNARTGLGKHFIVEGDEFHEAFINYEPIGLIVNNIEKDHLDYYKTEQNLVKAFQTVIKKVPKGGVIVANAQDEKLTKLLKKAKSKVLTFGIGEGDYQAHHIIRHGELTRFAVKGLENFDLSLSIPGEHNVRNALAASVMAISFGIKIDIIKKALLNFSGIQRRFEIKGRNKGAIIIDDYAHHPTEIKATLKTAKNYYPNKKIICVFQPHSNHRTRSLYNDFIKSFYSCDELVITDVYKVAGRESKNIVDMKKFADDVKKRGIKIKYIPNFRNTPKYLRKIIDEKCVVITMGAGDITEISDLLVKK
ncbi:MAG: UDP-N-acetylmuramate--L-alanine ligase [bacterium]|nr:UDP-N-acetylmuramate--L-alanine ligase [bacterium]